MFPSDTHPKPYLFDQSYHPESHGDRQFLKMHGHDVYKYAVKTVADTVKKCLDKAGIPLSEVKKLLIHQANQKMDEAILKRLFKLYQLDHSHLEIMPMTISWLGNICGYPAHPPDLLQRGELNNHILILETGLSLPPWAGMNINPGVSDALGHPTICPNFRPSMAPAL
jgi:3-oxoacyl-[acyl-carrier-protein] synthase-3